MNNLILDDISKKLEEDNEKLINFLKEALNFIFNGKLKIFIFSFKDDFGEEGAKLCLFNERYLRKILKKLENKEKIDHQEYNDLNLFLSYMSKFNKSKFPIEVGYLMFSILLHTEKTLEKGKEK